MLDLKYVREHAREVRQNLTDRGVSLDLDRLLEHLDTRSRLLAQLQKLREERNANAAAMKGHVEPPQRSELVEVGKRLKRELGELEARLAEENLGLTKKELLNLTRNQEKLERALGGIKDMGGLPDAIFVIDTNKEHIAIAEAKVLNIPVVAVLDSNSDPNGVDYPIPGNDDAIRAIQTYCDLAAEAILDGLQQEVMKTGGDIGEAETAPVENLGETSVGESEQAAADATAETPAETPAEAPAEAPAETTDEAPAESAPEAAPETPAEVPAEDEQQKAAG